jgi:ABC-type glycerol-3-phosphate transport system permease component
LNPRQVQPFFRQTVFLALSALALLPLYFMAVSSLKSQVGFARNPIGIPQAPTLENFATVVAQDRFLRWMGNSAILTFSSVVLALVISCMAAYAFARLPLRGGRLLFRLTTTLMAVPVVAVIVPLFVFLAQIGLVNNQPAVVLVYVGFMTPYTTFFLTGFFRRLPEEILDAAVIDGCSPASLLWRIVVPLSVAALATLTIVNALWAWNELLISLVLLQDDTLRTLMVGLTVFRDRFSINVPVSMAGLIVALVPMLLLYLLGLRYFVSGLLMGAVKGE